MTFDKAHALFRALTLDFLACSKSGTFPARVKLTRSREEYVAALEWMDAEANARRLLADEVLRLTGQLKSAVEWYASVPRQGGTK